MYIASKDKGETSKIGHFQNSRSIFKVFLLPKSSCKQFSLKNIRLEEQLLLKLLFILVIFVKVYLVKMCPIFDSSPPAFGARYQSFLRVC